MRDLDLQALSDEEFRTLRYSALAVVKHDDRTINPGADTVPDESR